MNENIQHLFLDCPFAKTIWYIIFFTANLNQPRSISHLFGTWLNNQPKNMKGLICVGVAALFWAIWRCRNDVIFNDLKTNSIMQVIFRGAYWLRSWSQFQHDEQAKETSLC
jgi:RsiW-degrading membrane proteinase PrsW (M82 family)